MQFQFSTENELPRENCRSTIRFFQMPFSRENRPQAAEN